MPWPPAFDVWLTDPDRWLWLGWSVVPDIMLSAGVIWLWRSLLRTRREARQQAMKAGDALARRTETLRWATELADVGAWFWDLPTGVVEWTDRTKAQFGLPADRVPSLEYFFSVVHPEDRDRVRAAINRSLADRQDYRTVFRAVHPDGSEHWIAAMGRPLDDVDGKPTSMGGVTLDVTRLHQIEDELRGLRVVTQEQASGLELAKRFQFPAENATDVVMETDNAGVIRWITPSVRQRIGRVGGWRDVHREVQAQEVVATERVRLHATQEGMFDPLAIVEPVRDDECRIVDFTYLDVNPAACAWLRTARDHLVGRRLCESFPEIESSGLLHKLVELTDTGRPLVLDDFPFGLRGTDLRRLDANDTILWLSPSVTPVLGWTQADGVGHDGKAFFATAETRDQFQRDKARVDELTGLLNRRALLERLEAAMARRERTIGLLWCDIDAFKAINDAHGHAAGDAVLEALAERIRGCLRSADDIGGRIGGDDQHRRDARRARRGRRRHPGPGR